MKRPLILLFLLTSLIASAACGSASSTNQPQASAAAKRYPMRGKVVSVDKASKRAKIAHEKIDGFMDAMTMDFPIYTDWVWEELTPGADVRADLVVDSTAKDPYWLENIGIVASAKPGQPAPPVDENFAQIGNPVSDFTLTNQDGKKITMKDFAGKALGITFIYARCPLPDYCIKMSTAFSDLALQLNNDPELKDKIRLLSVSFDPANDTPEKLRSYGQGYLGNNAKPDFTVWQLGVAPDPEVRKMADFFGLRYEVDQNDKTQINHSLRTIVISPEGKVTRIFPGSDWTNGQLLDELKATLK